MSQYRGSDGFASFDWGFNAPFCLLWWLCLSDGRFHIAREWKDTHHSDEEIARGYRAITKELGLTCRYVACDPSIFNRDGRARGESRADTLIRYRMPCRRSDHDRANGWARVHALLRLAPPDEHGEQHPWLTIDPSCRYLVRTLAAAVSKKDDPDDVGDADDHGLDALRYGAMSRPSPQIVTRRVKPAVGSLAYYAALDRQPAGLLAPGTVA